MKRFSLIVAALVSFATIGFSQGHDIKINIDGLTSGECILAHYYADQNAIVDTSNISPKGDLHFKGDEKLLNGVYILVLPNRSYMEFIVPKGDQTFSISFDTTLTANNKKAVGSLDNDAFFEFDRFAAVQGKKMFSFRKALDSASETEKVELRKNMVEIDKTIKEKRREIIAKYPNTFTSVLFNALLDVKLPPEIKNDTTEKRYIYYRNHYWDNFDLTNDGLIRTPIFKGKLVYYMTKLYIQIPDTIIKVVDEFAENLEKLGSKELFKYTVWWATNHYEDSKQMCMDKVLYHMAQNYYCAGRCFWADTSITNKMCAHAAKIKDIRCGEITPDVTMVDTTLARKYQLSQVKSPVTLLIFWDINCGHCKKEIPKFKLMYDTLHAQGVEVYAVYTQGDWEGWKKYVRENNLTWLNVMDAYKQTDFRKKYNIFSTPQTYILDENKQIIYKNAPADITGDIIKQMLDEYKEKKENKGTKKEPVIKIEEKGHHGHSHEGHNHH